MTLWIFFLCFCIAALSGLGVGGGGLLAVILSLFSELPVLTVQGINLYFFLFSGAASILVHLVKRRMRPGVVALCVLFGAIGTFVGSALAHSLGGGFTRKFFGGFLIVAGALNLYRCLSPLFGRKKRQKTETESEKPHKT